MLENQNKIIKILKKKTDLYNIYFDNNSNYLIHSDIIVKYNLYINKVIDNLDLILKDNNKRLIYSKIRLYFIKYPKSIKEAKIILKIKYNLDDSNIIDMLIKEDILNDQRFINNSIIRLENKLYGPNYINNYLYKHLINYKYYKEYENINDIFNKLIFKYKIKQHNRIKFLLNRGYFIEDIIKYIKE